MVGRLLTTREVAERLSVTVRTVRAYRRRGSLTAIRLDGTGPWRFYESSVDAFCGVTSSRNRKRPDALALNQAILARKGIVPPAERAIPLPEHMSLSR